MKVKKLYDHLDLFKTELKSLTYLKTVCDIACGHGKYSIIAKQSGFKTIGIDAREARVPIEKFNELQIKFKQSNLEDLTEINEDICLLFGIFYHLDLGQQLDLINKINSKVVLIHTLIYNDNSEEAFKLKHKTKQGNLEFAVYKEGNKRESRAKASMNNCFSIWHTEESLKNMFLNNGFKTFEKIKDITARSGFYKATK